MKAKNWAIACIAGAMLVSSFVSGIMSRIEAKRQAETNAALEQQYRYAVNVATINNQEIATLYMRAVAIEQQNDSLRTENKALIERIAASEARIAGIRKALEKPTRFSDSTKTSILNNLPK